MYHHRIMPRTTLDIDKVILEELKALQGREGKSLGRLASDLLADALARRRGARTRKPAFKWHAQAMRPRIDIGDKEALQAVLDAGGKLR